MLEQFIPKNFSGAHMRIIDIANAIIENYAASGLDLSLRQLYYQFVAHYGLENSEKSYKRLGAIISDARLAGLIDWERLVDRGRYTDSTVTYPGMRTFCHYVPGWYVTDPWETQAYHVEVMVEKQALEGVLLPTCRKWFLPFSCNKGYTSSSMVYQIGQRLSQKNTEGKKIVVIYLGDHDPSGMDMSRDIDDRLALMSGFGYYDDLTGTVERYEEYLPHTGEFNVIRVALNMPQIVEHNPPPNPTKVSDSRARRYIERFGYECWELDALEPRMMANLVEETALQFIDTEAWDAWKQGLIDERTRLREYLNNYDHAQ